jgi:hypothetical protein
MEKGGLLYYCTKHGLNTGYRYLGTGHMTFGGNFSLDRVWDGTFRDRFFGNFPTLTLLICTLRLIFLKCCKIIHLDKI